MAPEDHPYAGETGPSTVLVVLAGGAGRRYRASTGDKGHTGATGHKLLAELPATADEPVATVLDRAVAHALAADAGPVVVVTGAVDPPLPAGAIRCHNPRWADGQMSSVLTGIGAARERGAGAVVFGLGDQPGVTADAWRRVAGADGPIAVATYDGRRGNPVKLDAAVWDLLPAAGTSGPGAGAGEVESRADPAGEGADTRAAGGDDEGARALMRIRPDLVVEVPCTGSPVDIDTVEDLRRWQSS